MSRVLGQVKNISKAEVKNSYFGYFTKLASQPILPVHKQF